MILAFLSYYRQQIQLRDMMKFGLPDQKIIVQSGIYSLQSVFLWAKYFWICIFNSSFLIFNCHGILARKIRTLGIQLGSIGK